MQSYWPIWLTATIICLRKFIYLTSSNEDENNFATIIAITVSDTSTRLETYNK